MHLRFVVFVRSPRVHSQHTASNFSWSIWQPYWTGRPCMRFFRSTSIWSWSTLLAVGSSSWPVVFCFPPTDPPTWVWSIWTRLFWPFSCPFYSGSFATALGSAWPSPFINRPAGRWGRCWSGEAPRSSSCDFYLSPFSWRFWHRNPISWACFRALPADWRNWTWSGGQVSLNAWTPGFYKAFIETYRIILIWKWLPFH